MGRRCARSNLEFHKIDPRQAMITNGTEKSCSRVLERLKRRPFCLSFSRTLLRYALIIYFTFIERPPFFKIGAKWKDIIGATADQSAVLDVTAYAAKYPLTEPILTFLTQMGVTRDS